MLLTLGLVIAVIFVFLRNVSATVIPSLALPFSIIGTFSVMYLLKYSLDNLSMMALILSVGFVVDDAIVMLENIFRHMEMGKKPLVASLVGSKEIGFTIVSMTLSLAAVFIPGAVHERHPGPPVPRIFGHHLRRDSDFGRGLDHADAHAVQPLPARRPEHHDAWMVLPHHREIFRRDAARLRRHAEVGACAIACSPWRLSCIVLAATVWMFMDIPKGFIPDQDTDQISVITEALQGTSYYQMVEYQKQVADIVRAESERGSADVDRRRDRGARPSAARISASCWSA